MEDYKFLWKNRESDLKKVKRYFDPNHRFKVMYYRTNLFVHTMRVELLMNLVVPLAQECYENFDPKLAILISRFHDDPEMISKAGDISLHQKLNMNEVQLILLHSQEFLDAGNIARAYYDKGRPRVIEGYSYMKLLEYAIHKNIPEAQLHSYIDKVDGCCEAIHECLAGNNIFIEALWNYIQKTFSVRDQKFPMIKELFIEVFSNRSNLLQLPVVNLMDYFNGGKIKSIPHDEKTIKRKVGIPMYEEWRRITLNRMPNGFELLTKQKEFQ